MRLVFLRPVTVALVFACLILPFLLTAILLVPPGEVPDEEAHMVRADSLRHGEIMGRRGGTITMPDGQQGPSAGVIADPALLWAGKALPPGMGEKVDQAMLERVKGVAWGEATYVPVSNTAVYGPAFYVPTAIAIALVKAGGGTPYDAILAARGLNAIFITPSLYRHRCSCALPDAAGPSDPAVRHWPSHAAVPGGFGQPGRVDDRQQHHCGGLADAGDAG